MTDRPAVPPLPAADGRPVWPLWQRIAFRYLTLHWLLYAFPSPLSSLPSTVAAVWRRCLPEGGEMPEWAADTFKHIGSWSGKPYQWWKDLTTWLWENGLTFDIEVIHQPTGSGDTGHAYVRLACIIVISALLTALWSALDRRPTGHPVLGRWVHLGARWYVALPMLSYGLSKFYGGQFLEPNIGALTREVGDHSPMGLVWTFMGASTPYKYFAGIGEILGFVLLLHRRTALMGSFVVVGVMANVCALNWFYAVPVKLYSTHLLLGAVFLMAPFRHRLWALFVSNRASEPVDLRVVKSPWLGWPLLILGVLWAAGHATTSVWSRSESYSKRLETSLKKPALYGLWEVERMLRDGKPINYDDAMRWKSLAIDRGGYALARTLRGQAYPFSYEEDLEAGTVTLTPRGQDVEPIVWTIERSTVTRKAGDPAPQRREDFTKRIDVEREAIRFVGEWRGQSIELFTVKKVFRLHDPFRLVREFPR